MTASSPPRPWHLAEVDAIDVGRLRESLDLPELVARVLVRRGLNEPEVARAFLDASLATMPDPAKLADAERAAERLIDAFARGEQITIYGDYDVDGVTSTAVLSLFCAEVFDRWPDVYIPHRLNEGYGLNREAIAHIADSGSRVLVTVDNGSSAFDEIDYARSRGIDVIVIDHHQVSEPEPPAYAHLNPHRKSCEFPDDRLAAVGVAFLLVVVMRRILRDRGHFGARPQPRPDRLLDLVALGTVADLAPLVGLNRAFVRHGLGCMQRGPRMGVRALMDVARVEASGLTARDLGFRLGPRLNAAGRVDDARAGLWLLLGDDPRRARELAAEVDAHNVERQSLERAMTDAAVAQFEAGASEVAAIVVFDRNWHPGVVGIVASRLVDRYHRPAIVLGHDGRRFTGSGRSIAGFNLKAALDACADHLMRYGGHIGAAGMAMSESALPQFREAFLGYTAGILGGPPPPPPLEIDAEIVLGDASNRVFESLERVGPFGRENPAPRLVARRVRAQNLRTMRGGHLKMEFVHADGPCEAIAWRMESRRSVFDGAVDVVFTPGFEVFRGRRRLVLTIADVRPCDMGSIATGPVGDA